MFKLLHNCTHLTQQQSNAQNSPSQASTVRELWTSTCSSCIWKRQRNQRSNCQQPLDHQNSKSSRKASTSALLSTPKPLTLWITVNYGKFLKRWEYQATWPASWEFCMQVKKQQLQLDMAQQTGSNSGKEYVKAVYCHPAYLIYIHITSCKMPGWMKHKLESRLPGEISITSDTQITPPLWQKAKNN